MAEAADETNRTKIAIVTGGSRGLGRSTVLSLAKRGCGVIFTYHSNDGEARVVVDEVGKAHGKAIAIQLDTGLISSFDGFVGIVAEGLEKTWGDKQFDYLVNNAGLMASGPIATMTEGDFDTLVNVHFKGVFFLTQKLLPLIKDGGRIVNLSSGLARFTGPGCAAYGSMKGAIEVLTRYMAKEFGPRQIAVNVVAPGAIETDFGGGAVRDNPEFNKMVAAATAMGRAGVPDDIGPMIAALLSDENRWVTGQRIEVSGGLQI
jgi:NAD(P)-dependent dehydrogenase (short-subunit alcohol dehydrogenase family)